jgi:hypothetical protein
VHRSASRIGPAALGVTLAIAGAASAPAGGAAQDSAHRERAPDVMFVPTPVGTMLAMLRLAGVGDSDRVYDLGSGDGRLVITAAKQFGARGVGIDIDPQRVAEGRSNADTAGVAGRVTFRQGDLFETELRPATVVTLYLTTTLNERLRPKLFRELRPGTRVVSNSFEMGDWKPDSTAIAHGYAQAETPVHLWIMPANARGAWRITLEDAGTGTGTGRPSIGLRFTQRFQQLSGTATVNGRPVVLSEARLRGDHLSFAVPLKAGAAPWRFVGRISGDTAVGTAAGERNLAPHHWRGIRIGASGAAMRGTRSAGRGAR